MQPEFPGSHRPAHPAGPLELSRLLAGRRLVVVGGTGFLGKVWCALVLSHFPDIAQIYLVVRPKDGLGVRERFSQKVLTSGVFHPLREKHGADFESFIDEKITPISGDVSQPLCGLDAPLRDEMRGQIDAVVNVAGVVDFDPPLDEALEVNAFGCQNLVALARDLGDVRILHTSTCFTAGSRTGPIEEQDPREIPFPRAFELDPKDWSPDREIAECLDVIEQARHRANDAFRQSYFLDLAKSHLEQRDEPLGGDALDDELARVKRRFVEEQLAELGMERARYWGWPNTYTYTKSIGEQIVASSGLPFCIVRPAIVESTLGFPFPGWNEGINTSAPIIFLIREGGLQVPGSRNNLDMIPCDLVCGAILLALGELLEGTQRPVYQAASSDTNPCSMARFFELSGLAKRRYYKQTGKGGPILSALQANFESALLSKKQYDAYGPHQLARGAEKVSRFLRQASVGPLHALTTPAAKNLDGFAKQQKKIGRIMDTFLPFLVEYHYVFRTDAVRRAHARLPESDQALVPWGPESIEWRDWFLNVHVPALERHVFPEMEERLKKKVQAPRPHPSLTSLLDDMAERHDLRVALSRTEHEGLSRITYRELRCLAHELVAELQRRGIEPRDRVLLCAKNHPSWPVAFFGILAAGATVVPLDAAIEPDAARVIAEASRAKLMICDAETAERLGGAVDVPGLDLWHAARPERSRGTDADDRAGGPTRPVQGPIAARPEDLAALIYTSGTTGKPKGVMLTHQNITSLIAALAPLFPLGTGDRVLSVLPLHHTFELSCGLLLPLSRGARVVYLDELSASRLESGLRQSRATALIGVPALWEMIERRILSRVADKGPFAEKAFDAAVEISRTLSKQTGIDFGRALFGTVHQGLGGHLKYLVSGGAALHPDTHGLFQGLGLHLSEGYGLTESAPVLTVALGGPQARAGSVGQPVSNVELRIKSPDKNGVGEVLARGPNIMVGYADDEESTRLAIDADGWLHTGDLGRLDSRGRLSLVGRKKDVVVTKTGENVYPDDVEAQLGDVPGIKELCVLGIPDGRGGERLACAAVAEDRSPEGEGLAKEQLQKSLHQLPLVQRPAVVAFLQDALPRTTTKKVRRKEVRELVVRATERASLPPPGQPIESTLAAAVYSSVATIARRKPADVASTMTLRGELGFDSLMALELLTLLESRLGRSLDGEKLAQASTVGELVRTIEGEGLRPASRTTQIEGQDEPEDLTIPLPLREAAMAWMGRGQKSFYRNLMRTSVSGQAFIPHNRPTLVVANHCSHLDMGLVKYALGTYGDKMVTLAAQDYFFEGPRLKRLFFEQLSYLEPMPRSGNLRAALRHAGELLDSGKTVLIFPEGTRSPDGRLMPFKPAMGHLALHHQVDILPVWLGGTFAALPRGSKVPATRSLSARVGPALSIHQIKQLLSGLSSSDAARIVSKIAELAVAELSRGRLLELADLDVAALRRSELPEEEGLTGVFRELSLRFVRGAVEQPVSYYFSLGEERWTVRATSHELEVNPGKTIESVDCVLKTSPENFTRIIREAWVPGAADFMTGQIKTNNVAHLLTLQKLFRLSVPTQKLEAALERERLSASDSDREVDGATQEGAAQ